MTMLPLKKVAGILGLHRTSVWYLVKKGKLKGERIGRDWLVSPEALREYWEGKDEDQKA